MQVETRRTFFEICLWWLITWKDYSIYTKNESAKVMSLMIFLVKSCKISASGYPRPDDVKDHRHGPRIISGPGKISFLDFIIFHGNVLSIKFKQKNIWIYIQYQTVKRIPLEYIQYQLQILLLVLARFLCSPSIDFPLLHEWQLDTNEWGILRWRIRWKETDVQQIAKKFMFTGCLPPSQLQLEQSIQVSYALSSFGECV